jgi:hypothetical protein
MAVLGGSSQKPLVLAGHPRSRSSAFERVCLPSSLFTFLIRHPYLSVPSYYRLSLPGEKEASQVKSLTTNDLGYSELRRLFDYLREEGLIGRSSAYTPQKAANGTNGVYNGDNARRQLHIWKGTTISVWLMPKS